MPYFSARLDFLSPPLSAPGSPRMDDTQIYLSFKPNNGTPQEDAIRVMEWCIKKMWRCLIKDRLLVNDDKTEFKGYWNSAAISQIAGY